MSSAVVSTSAAWGRLFVFDAGDVEERPLARPEAARPEAHPQPSGEELFGADGLEGRPPQRVRSASSSAFSVRGAFSQDARLAGVTSASRMEVRPAAEMVSTGIAALDALAGGLPRGCLTEICGPASSGRTTLLLAALAAATRRGEFCAVVDASDALDPHSAAAAGVDLNRMLWVRCGENSPQKCANPERCHPFDKLRASSERSRFSGGAKDLPYDKTLPLGKTSERRLEQVLRATDLLLESGGFGLIALDLSDVPLHAARRIPLATWFRFRRAVEYKPTVLLAIEQLPIAGSCSSLLIRLDTTGNRIGEQSRDFEFPAHAQLLTGLKISAELVRSRLDRKPAGSVAATFASKTAWAG